MTDLVRFVVLRLIFVLVLGTAITIIIISIVSLSSVEASRIQNLRRVIHQNSLDASYQLSVRSGFAGPVVCIINGAVGDDENAINVGIIKKLAKENIVCQRVFHRRYGTKA